MIADKLLVISSLLLAMSLVGVKGKTNSKAKKEAEEGSSKGEGRATILYQYSDVQVGASITAEVPVSIKRDEVFPDKWQVRGSKRTTCSSLGQRAYSDGSMRSIRRDFEVRIYFDGELVPVYEEGESSCQFQVRNFFVNDMVENKSYGNPPLNYKDLFESGSAFDVYGALPEKYWIFDKYNRVVHVPRPEDQNLKAIITDIHWPGEMREGCRWD